MTNRVLERRVLASAARGAALLLATALALPSGRLPGQTGAQTGVLPVRTAIETVLGELDGDFARGDVAAYLRRFAPDHPGAHAMHGVHLRRLLQLGDGPARRTRLLGTPRTIGPRVVADVEHTITFADERLPADFEVVERAVMAFQVTAGNAAKGAVPTFAVDVPMPRRLGEKVKGEMVKPVGNSFRCSACNYAIGGESGWLCVPMPDERAQALEGATFYLIGSDLACDISVRIADHEATALSTARALGEGLRELDPGTRPGLATTWLPPAHEPQAHEPGGAAPSNIEGARLQARRSDGGVATLHVVQFGGLQHVLLARCSAATWLARRDDLQRLLASYHLLDTDCDFAGTAAKSLRHHTGGTLTGVRYRNDTSGIELLGPNGWRVEQRGGGAAFRVVWTSPAGSRLWLVGYPVPTGLSRWCTASADRWLDKLSADAGLDVRAASDSADVDAAGTDTADKLSWTPFAPLSEAGAVPVAARSRMLRCVPRRVVDPTAPQERLLRAVVRNDLLVLIDAIPADAADLPALRAALDGLTAAR